MFPKLDSGTTVAKLERIPQPRFIKFPSVSIIVPTLNEEKNLPYVLPHIPLWVKEIILVDGHSEDNTIEVARQIWPTIKVVKQIGQGKGRALRQGFSEATGDILLAIDADGSTNPLEIPSFVGALMAGKDYVKGSRFLQGGGTADMEMIRRLGNLALTWLVRILFGGRYSDLCYGYFGFWKRVLPELIPECSGFEVETLIGIRAIKAGLKIAEVPSYEAKRVFGSSNLKTFRDGWRVLCTILREKMI
jgi:glycosyltransferase involved in cell wall biosynthesis